MNELADFHPDAGQKVVWLAPNTREPFTTSAVIAECAAVTHDAVQKMIARHEADFKSFGQVGFEIRAVRSKRGTKYAKIYHLNEQQATLLMTYLRNTDVVREFKKELVRQFYAMRQELFKVQAVKSDRKAIRVRVTDAIQALPDSPHKEWKYKQYTDLVYLTAVGKTAKAIRQERGAAKDATASDYMSADELEAVTETENRVGVLIEAGMSYGQIKEFLENRHISATASHGRA